MFGSVNFTERTGYLLKILTQVPYLTGKWNCGKIQDCGSSYFASRF